jgi:hypothetical protein
VEYNTSAARSVISRLISSGGGSSTSISSSSMYFSDGEEIVIVGCAGGVGASAAFRNGVVEIALDHGDGEDHRLGRWQINVTRWRANMLDCCRNNKDARRVVVDIRKFMLQTLELWLAVEMAESRLSLLYKSRSLGVKSIFIDGSGWFIISEL